MTRPGSSVGGLPIGLPGVQALSDGRGRGPVQSAPVVSDRDFESLATPNSVHGEVASVAREYDVGFQVFSKDDQGGIGEVHGAIGILHHELARATQGGGTCRHNDGAARQNEIQTGNATAGNPRKKVCRFREYRLCRRYCLLPRLKEISEFPMPVLAAIKQRN